MSNNTLMDMKVSDFKVDQRVQRVLNEARVKALMDDFKPPMLGLVNASLRQDGNAYILDGQHRVVAAQRLNYDGPIATRVWEGLSIEEEAELFLTLNNVKTVSAVDKFLVRVTQGDPSAVAINKALERANLKVSTYHKGGMFAAIVALEKIYAGLRGTMTEPHLDLVEDVLEILVRAYRYDNRAAFQASTLMGVAMVLQVYGKQADKNAVIKALESTDAETLAKRGRAMKDLDGGTTAQGVAKVIVGLYNKNKSTNRLEVTELISRISRTTGNVSDTPVKRKTRADKGTIREEKQFEDVELFA